VAHKAKTLIGVEEAVRPFFGLSLGEMIACVGSYIVAQRVLPPPTGLVVLLPFIPGLVLAGVLTLGHKVRVEPYLAQLNGWLLRRLGGQPHDRPVRGVPHRIIEVDGFTREALTEDEQDHQVIWRLQQQLAALGRGGELEMLAVKESQDSTAIVRRIRATTRPTTPALARLVERRCARLAGSAQRGSAIHYYVVVYEPARWRKPAWLLRLPLVGSLLVPSEEDTSLDDITITVREALVNMGLRPTLVPAAVRVAGSIRRGGEGLTYAALDDARYPYASSFYMLLAPGETDPGFADPLVNTEGPYHLAIRCHGTDPDREAARIGSQQNRNVVMALTGARVSAVQDERVGEADRALLALRKPGQGIARLGVYYTAFGATRWEAERKARRAQLTVKRAMAARAARGLGHQGPLYRAAHVGPDVARSAYRVHVETAANAYPFNRDNPSMPAGYRVGQTARGEEVLFDPTDESLRNALVVILGLSGMGKTHLVMRLLREHLERAGRVTVVGASSGHYGYLAAFVGGVTVRTADELDAVPPETQMVIVDIGGSEHLERAMMLAIDRRVQAPVGELQHALVFEEAWQLEHMDASLWVNDLARRGRHWGGYVLWVSHDPEDLLQHKHIAAMFKNAATKISFALSDRKGVASAIGGALELSDKQVRTIKSLARGECYILRHNVLRGSVVQGVARVDAEPEELWLYLTDPRLPQYKTREEYIARHEGDIAAAIFDLADHEIFNAEDASPMTSPVEEKAVVAV